MRALESEDADTVLLHFSGYSYASRGLCFWLPAGLACWKRRAAGRRLVTMFHELYAMGPPWRTSFWTSAPQRWIARRLVELSDAMVCGYELVAHRIRAWTAKPVVVMPVFSNVGELDDPPPLDEREPIAVVFGGERTRSSIAAGWHSSELVLQRWGIRRLIEVGPGRSFLHGSCRSLDLQFVGAQPPEAVSALLRRASVGIVGCPVYRLGGSGVLAAFVAHGCLGYLPRAEGPLSDGLRLGTHVASESTPSSALPAIARAGRSWYGTHNRDRTVDLFRSVLDGHVCRYATV